VGIDEQGLYMVLDYVEGSSLATLVDRVALRGERMPIPLVLRIALDILAGLAAVHRSTGHQGEPLGILHRDVSLQNVLIGRDGIARLTDFGIAKGARSSINTKAGNLVGKLLYLPPEYIRQAPVAASADLYMLGITLWCAITGEEPWQAETEAQLMHHILSTPLPSLGSRLNEPVAPEIETLIGTACRAAPSERFQSAEEMTLAIDRLGRDRGWVASQHEVSTFVEHHLGTDLDRRRERVAQALADSNSIGKPVPAATQKARRMRAAAWGLGVCTLATAGFFIYSRSKVASVSDSDLVKQELRAASSPSVVSTPRAVSSTSSGPAMPTATSSQTASSAASSAVPAPTSSAIRENTARRTVVRKVPTAERATVSPAIEHNIAAPDEISTRNPYRQ
jgi:serine/threonine-protein kinase